LVDPGRARYVRSTTTAERRKSRLIIGRHPVVVDCYP
jgi:hypothetical protein